MGSHQGSSVSEIELMRGVIRVVITDHGDGFKQPETTPDLTSRAGRDWGPTRSKTLITMLDTNGSVAF